MRWANISPRGSSSIRNTQQKPKLNTDTGKLYRSSSRSKTTVKSSVASLIYRAFNVSEKRLVYVQRDAPLAIDKVCD